MDIWALRGVSTGIRWRLYQVGCCYRWWQQRSCPRKCCSHVAHLAERHCQLHHPPVAGTELKVKQPAGKRGRMEGKGESPPRSVIGLHVYHPHCMLHMPSGCLDLLVHTVLATETAAAACMTYCHCTLPVVNAALPRPPQWGWGGVTSPWEGGGTTSHSPADAVSRLC